MPTAREQEIIDAYLAWDPDSDQSVGDLAAELGISRSRLYAVLHANEVPLKSQRRSSTPTDPLLSEMAEVALSYLLNQLQEARDELRQYRERYGPI